MAEDSARRAKGLGSKTTHSENQSLGSQQHLQLAAVGIVAVNALGFNPTRLQDAQQYLRAQFRSGTRMAESITPACHTQQQTASRPYLEPRTHGRDLDLAARLAASGMH